MEYAIIEDWDLKKFLEKVNRALANGWRPQGGVTFNELTSVGYLQAFVRD